MPERVSESTVIKAAGNQPKIIEEYRAVCLPAFAPDRISRDA